MNRRGFLGGIVATATAITVPASFQWRELLPSGDWVYLNRDPSGDFPTIVGRMYRRGVESTLGFYDDGENYNRRMKSLLFAFKNYVYAADVKDGIASDPPTARDLAHYWGD